MATLHCLDDFRKVDNDDLELEWDVMDIRIRKTKGEIVYKEITQGPNDEPNTLRVELHIKKDGKSTGTISVFSGKRWNLIYDLDEEAMQTDVASLLSGKLDIEDEELYAEDSAELLNFAASILATDDEDLDDD